MSNRVFASARSQGTKENTACQEVRLTERIMGVGVRELWEGMEETLPLWMESAQFLIFCLGHEACLVLSLARGIFALSQSYLPQSLRLLTLGCLACSFNLLSFFVMVVLSLQLITYSTGTLRFDLSMRSQREFIANFPLSRLTEWFEERRELLAHGVWIVCISNLKPRQPSAQGFPLISWVFWHSTQPVALMR